MAPRAVATDHSCVPLGATLYSLPSWDVKKMLPAESTQGEERPAPMPEVKLHTAPSVPAVGPAELPLPTPLRRLLYPRAGQ
jgi:hypothetical protein